MANIGWHLLIAYYLLYPLGWLWERIYKLRRSLYLVGKLPRKKFNIPVISIGNITFGGTGKTPVTIFLADYLQRNGKKSMVLTRGYKSQVEHSFAILKHDASLRYNAKVYGDEPVLIAEKLNGGSVVIGKARGENFERAFAQEKPHVVLLDDGHQHLAVDRNLNIVLFDSLVPFKEYLYPPLGRLREGWSALFDADIVLINRVDIVSREKVESLVSLIQKHIRSETPIVKCRYVATGWTQGRESYSLDHLKGKRVFCVAGIASPESFVELTKRSGAEVVGSRFYSDHFRYTKTHFDYLVKLAQKENATLVCTEKDFVKVRTFINQENIYALRTGIEIEQGEQEFFRLINKVCSIRGKR